MAIPTPQMLDAIIHGVGISMLTEEIYHVPISTFWNLPEPGERDPWPRCFWLGRDWYGDGGDAAISAYQFGLCSTYPTKESP
jgi:hypothetical protein